MKRKIHNIAHKGASAKYPENTFLAFEKALLMGADTLELDLRLSSDKHVVVIHDSEIVTGNAKKLLISAIPYSEIKKLNLEENQKIPDFAELVKKFKKRCKFYIDLKDENALEYVINILINEDCLNSAILGSNNISILKKSKLLNKKLKTSLLISLEDRGKIFDLGKMAQSDYLHPCWEKYSESPSSLLTEDFFKKAEKDNFKIVIWHEERENELKELCKKPVYGICTDMPDILNGIINTSF